MIKNTYCFLQQNNVFSQIEFKHPPVDCSPIYTWVWNGPLTREETDSQLGEMKRMGIKAFYILPQPQMFRAATIPTYLQPDYLTTPYFEEYRYAIQKAGELGMTTWLYDEGGWPSGGAANRVLFQYPELAKRNLASRTMTYDKDMLYHPSNDVAAAFIDVNTRIYEGFAFEQDTEVTEYYSRRNLFEKPGSSDYPDLTRKESTEAFLKITHEQYKIYLQEFFGTENVMRAVFSDESSAPRPVPFYEEIEEEFECRNGYSIRSYLQELMGHKEAKGKAREAIIAWYDLCSELFCRNYMLAEKAWCNRNGLAFLGHMDMDHIPHGFIKGGNFQIMRALRCFDVPGIDVIWRQIFPCEEQRTDFGVIMGENTFFPRYASSAAEQIGGRHALTESFAVYGSGLTFDQMRYVITFQAVRGINIFNPMLIPYGREGFLRACELPHFIEGHACYSDLKYFNEYMERVSYISSLGRNVSHTALYLPINDFWADYCKEECSDAFKEAGNMLEDMQIPFDIFDDDLVKAADPDELRQGVLALGNARYTSVVIPPCKFMPSATIARLEIFINGGGKVFVMFGHAAPVINGALGVETLKETLQSPLAFVGSTTGIRLAERAPENGKLFLISNENLCCSEVSIRLPERNGYLLELTTGSIYSTGKEGEVLAVDLQSGEMIALLFTDKVLEIRERLVCSKEIILNNNLTIKKTEQFIIGQTTSDTIKIQEDAQPVALGDWKVVTGSGFSGSCVYEMQFITPQNIGEKVLLDLGDVRYTCEVFLNGKSLGVKIMSPYQYEIFVKDLKPVNQLQIRITNTPANEFNATRAFDVWQDWQLSPYWERQKIFHKDSMYGGLYGPVRIIY